jgi:DNA polymerase-3 subunit alpha
MDKKEKMEWEKELLGLFLTDHPLSPYMKTIKDLVSHYSGQLREVQQKEKVTVAGRLTNIRSIVTKKGNAMGFATLEDVQGVIGLVIFPSSWEKARDILIEDQVVVVRGKADVEGMDAKVLVDEISMLEMDSDTDEAGTNPGNDPADDGWGFMPQEIMDEGMNPMNEEFMEDSAPDITLQSDPIPEQNNGHEKAVEEKPADYSTGEIADTTKKNGASRFDPVSIVKNNKNLTIIINASGKKEQDIRLLKQVYGMLRSSPGEDRFTLLCREDGREVELDFPNDAIHISDDLLEKVNHLVGEENVHIQENG